MHNAAQLLPTPVVSDLAQLRAAFALMHWPGWTFEQAMAFDLRRQLLIFHAGKVAPRSSSATLNQPRKS